MSANIFKQTSAAGVNLTRVKVVGANLLGGLIINTNAAARCVKLYFFLPGTSGQDVPTVGTTVPSLTIQCAASSMTPIAPGLTQGVSMKGDLWMATTVNPADTDATAVGAADLITQLFIE